MTKNETDPNSDLFLFATLLSVIVIRSNNHACCTKSLKTHKEYTTRHLVPNPDCWVFPLALTSPSFFFTVKEICFEGTLKFLVSSLDWSTAWISYMNNNGSFVCRSCLTETLWRMNLIILEYFSIQIRFFFEYSFPAKHKHFYK